MTCDICNGRKVVRLQKYRSLFATMPDVRCLTTEIRDTEENYRDYPCPECSAPDMLKVRHVEVKTRELRQYEGNAEYRKYIEKDLARGLADFLLRHKDEFVTQTEYYQKEWGANEVKWTLSLLTTDSYTPNWRAQVDEALQREISNIQMVAKEKIYGWNGNSAGLHKDRAVICLNEAIIEVLGYD